MGTNGGHERVGVREEDGERWREQQKGEDED